MKRRALFIGRFQPFHDGHKWLIQQALDKGEPVLVAVMDYKKDKRNPYNAKQVKFLIEAYYYNAFEDVVVIIIPPISSVNYGRDVGYEIIEHKPPEHIAEISATRIREIEQ
ncbi:MAG: adenylyltransferase/cytidyltransferase family protein [Candidatus Thorarchaeota archaeon]|jgi:cytidyltransferase-like protein